MTRLRRWADITREERFFTCELFHELKQDPDPFFSLFRTKLKLRANQLVQDIGYEVCLARDLWHAKLLKTRCRPLEKQTIDFVLSISGNDLLFIEVKAHQGFGRDQIKKMEELKDLLKESYPNIDEIHLGGLHSSKYSPQNIRKEFKSFAMCTWKELVPIYPRISSHIQRADEIYRN